ncbi:MAG TPA: HAMP domain-containing sensor histidine kinase, partial [Verrucomicrobiaceae bacterium]
KTATSPATSIFSSGESSGEGTEPPTIIRFNRQPKGVRSSSSPPSEGRWVFEGRLHPGALEAIVAGSRRRNLGVALGLNLLILASGLVLVRHTRRSRLLAEAQMNFVANVSHELRTPLTVIQVAAQNLQRGIVSAPDRLEQYSSLIAQHAGRLRELIEQVLEFASVKKRQAQRPGEPVSVSQIVKDAAAATAPDASAAGCETELNVPDSPFLVSGDGAALGRAFQNLMANAIKHGGHGRWIGINLSESHGDSPPSVEVRVSDRGPGIPEAERAQIFLPFFRGARAQEQQIPGSGLGLSLAREIVEASGGSISVSDTEGGGATFTVSLPQVKPNGNP